MFCIELARHDDHNGDIVIIYDAGGRQLKLTKTTPTDPTEIYHYQTELFNQFQSDYNGYKELKHQRFSNSLIAYADYKNMTFEKDKNHKGRWIMFKTK